MGKEGVILRQLRPGDGGAAEARPGEADQEVHVTRGQLWTARVLSTFAVLFLTFDTGLHLADPQVVTTAAVQLGLPADLMFKLGILEAILLMLYLVPRTAILGALLWTGYLGGAILTNLRVGLPLFSHVLFPTYVAALLWVPLWLREPRLRALLPFRQS